jgi:hypothetical protein
MKSMLFILLLTRPAFACEDLIERGIILAGLGAASLEAVSAITAYFSREDTANDSQRNFYLAQTVALGASSIALTLGLLINRGLVPPKIAGLIFLDAIVGATMGFWVYSRNAFQTGMTKTAITTAVLGLGSHISNIALLMVKAACCCKKEPSNEYQAV